ncbi:3-oxoacyl-[acyl-carrier protein] reductase [Thermogutta terrifontis]|uniref:3-oxoacyl-[acyl-carrier protein] reductase n=1 Tax=Thermogutta terrifontis TaxID=1331910 RepID=A0A286RFU3_9BACT|nr:3-ketoacyl-ACP reductase [Thermogutta terrifontis]ASV74831.1 3-oxoacyl-[acyl-carrier protein] reductase [Thermogutta terrifontis]
MTSTTAPSLPAALVTGGSRGIGAAIALTLGELGYHVFVNYATRPEAAQTVVASIVAKGGSAEAIQADVGNAADRERMIACLENYGRWDVLVNNAGITSVGRKDILEATEESWDRVFATNLKGPFFLSQAAGRKMIDFIRAGRQEKGYIINISSVSAFAVSTNRADYCLTKAAMHMMTQLFAQRLAEEKIQVFEICPGVIESDMTAPVKEKYDRLIAEGAWPIRRWGRPEDVARAVAAIVQDYFPFSTGARFLVDGGFHIRTL